MVAWDFTRTVMAHGTITVCAAANACGDAV